MKYFTIDELCRSNTASRLGIDNTPPPDVVKNLEALVDAILDPLREDIGAPIIVDSGYRCQKLNKVVGGAAKSQHTKGEAADINIGSAAGNKRIYDAIKANFDFDQLIDEHNFSWVHVSYKAAGVNRRQTLKIG